MWLAVYALAAAEAPPPYNIHESPLSNRQFGLLFKRGYTVKTDGTVWAPGAPEPISMGRMGYLIEELAGAERLKTLLTLRLILSRSDGEGNLKPQEREEIRKIVRDNWSLLSYDTRKDFRGYFTPAELETMNADSPLPKPPHPVVLEDAEAPSPSRPAAPAGTPVPVPIAAAPPLMIPLGVKAWDQGPRSPKGDSPPSPQGAAALEPPASPAVPAPPAPAPPAPAAAPAPVDTVKPDPAATAATGSMSALPAGMTPAEPPAAPPAPAPAPPPALERREAVHSQTPVTPTSLIPSMTPEDFERFVSQCPYSREVRALLRLLSQNAPEFARKRALSLIVGTLPPIVIDGSRMGWNLRAGLLPADATPPGVVLSPGPAFREFTRLLFISKETVLLPQSPEPYAELGVAAPAIEALTKGAAPTGQEASDWGELQRFEDASLRGSFSPQQQAGTLLWALVRLDLARRGEGQPPYLAELYSRTAQMMLYRRLEFDIGSDSFLDPETRAAYRQWLDQPGEYRDHLVHTLAAGRDGRIDPARAAAEDLERGLRERLSGCPASAAVHAEAELAAGRETLKARAKALGETGLLAGRAREEAELGAQRWSPRSFGDPCRRWTEELAALGKAAALWQELLSEERKFRRDREYSEIR